MISKISIQIRAFCLLIVFSSNTVVGFACSIGIDMGYNSSHHTDIEIPIKTDHSQTKGHNHKTGNHDNLNKTGGHIAHHNEGTDFHKGSSSDDCCSNEITSLLQEEKNLARSLSIEYPVLQYFYPAPFYITETSFLSTVNTNKKYFVRNYHPPIPDIRIAIQSFQI